MGQNKLTMYETAVYRICIQGALDDTWAQCLGTDMRVQASPDIPESVTTTITIETSDQAALMGLLNSFYTIGLPLLSVQRVEKAVSAQP